MKYIVINDKLGIQTALKIEDLKFRRGYMSLGKEHSAHAICIIPLTQEGKSESDVKDIVAEIALRRGQHSVMHIDTDKKVVSVTPITMGHGLEVKWEEPSEVYNMGTSPVFPGDAFISMLEDPADRTCMYKLSQVM